MRYSRPPHDCTTNTIPSFLIRRIIAFNSFGCPLSTLTSSQRRTSHPQSASEKDGAFHSCGLWPTGTRPTPAAHPFSCYPERERETTVLPQA
jgi:hypothetical protein